MTTKKRTFHQGIKLKPDTSALSEEGEVKYDDTAKKVQYQDDSATRSVVSENGTQTIENKTIDATSATGNNTLSADAVDIDYDNASSGLTATDLQAAVDELDTRLEGQDDASEISYDNTSSGLTATNVQAAIDENDGRLDTIEGASYVNSFNTRTGAVTAAASDYDADQIDYDNTTSGLTATDTQAAIDEVEGRVDTIEGATYVNSFNTRTGAVVPAASDYDADQIDYDNATSGLAATDAQAAIDEVDGDLDAHIIDTTTHGTTGDIVGTSDAQVLTNKDVDGGTASNTSRVTMPKATKTTLDGLTRKEGTIAYANDEQLFYGDNGTDLVPIGAGGSGELNFFPEGDFESPAVVGDWDTGKNATFDGGGTLGGTFVFSTTAADLVRGKTSGKYTNNATAGSSDNDYVASPNVQIPQGYRGRLLKLQFQYTSEFADGNVVARVKDNTTGTILTGDSLVMTEFTNSDDNSKQFTATFFCPTDCAQVIVGFQVLTGESSKVITIDDIVVSPNSFVVSSLTDYDLVRLDTGNGHGSTNTAIRRFANIREETSNGVIQFTDNSTDGTSFTALRDCFVSVSYTDNLSGVGTDYFGISLNSTQLTTGITAINTQDRLTVTLAGAGQQVVAWSGYISAGDIIRPHDGTLCPNNSQQHFTIYAEAKSEAVLHYGDSAENVFSVHVDGGTTVTDRVLSKNYDWIDTTQGNGGITRNSTGNYTVHFKSGFFSVAPNCNASAHHADPDTVSVAFPATTSSVQVVCSNLSNAVRDRSFSLFVQRQDTDYRDPHSYAITPITQTAYLKDHKAANNQGGTFTSGSWQTRDLNTVTGDTGIVQLSSSQFTLQPGKYEIEVVAPAFKVATHKVKLRNTTDSTDDIIGSNSQGDATDNTQNEAFLMGIIEISSAKTFEIQHRCSSTYSSNGFGVAANFGVDEVYTQVKITKLLSI